MIATISDKNEVITGIANAVSILTELMSAVAAEKVNMIPYPGSWTAPQLLQHVSKSIAGMAKALEQASEPAERDPGKRIEELKAIFLDFSKKMQSPDFIVPDERDFEREQIIGDLNNAFDVFRRRAAEAQLNEVVEGLPLGPISKLEILHFTLFHTQRHLHQMNKICDALRDK